MNCDEVEDLLGAYALDALSPGDAALLREHLAGCEEHAEKASELRATAVRLPAAAGAVAPPAALKRRVLSAIAGTSQSETPYRGPLTFRPRAERAPKAPRVLAARPPPYAWGAVAAVLVAAFGALVAWNIVLMNRGANDVGRLATRATDVRPLTGTDGGPHGTVVYFAADKMAVVYGDSMPALDSDRTYQLWAITGGRPESIGLMRAEPDGRATVIVPFDTGRSSALAVTIEPAGGSDQPTSTPVAEAEL